MFEPVNPFDRPGIKQFLITGLWAGLSAAIFNCLLRYLGSSQHIIDFNIYSFQLGFPSSQATQPEVLQQVTPFMVFIQSLLAPIAGAVGFWILSRTLEHYRKAFWFVFVAVWLFSFTAPYAVSAHNATKEILGLMHIMEGIFFIAFFRKF